DEKGPPPWRFLSARSRRARRRGSGGTDHDDHASRPRNDCSSLVMRPRGETSYRDVSALPAGRLGLVVVFLRALGDGRPSLDPHSAALDCARSKKPLPKVLRLIHCGELDPDEHLVWIVHRARDLVGSRAALRSPCWILVEPRLPRLVVVYLEVQEHNRHRRLP